MMNSKAAPLLLSTRTAQAIVETDSSRRFIPLLALLVLSIFINYIDRGNLSIAAPMLKDELHISASQLGGLLSAFFWSYAIFLVISGWLVDRFPVGWVMAAGFAVWSVATIATGFVHGFTALLIARVALGIGESVAYPAYGNILAKYVPAAHRGVANSMIAVGLASGSIFGMLAGGTLMAYFGWRPFFIGFGAISLVWLAPWVRWMPRRAALPAAISTTPAPRTLDIVRHPKFLATCCSTFCNAYLLYTLIAWLPFYLVRERHFSVTAMARVGAAVYLTQAVVSAIAGRFTDRRVATHGSVAIHRTQLVIGMMCSGIALFLSAVVPSRFALPLLLLAGAGLGMTSSNLWPITQILAGPRAAGRWTGVQNAVGNTAGVATTTLTGFLLDRTGHFFWPFAIVALLCCIGALAWTYLVGAIQPVDWNALPAAAAWPQWSYSRLAMAERRSL
jgi:MFS family permease